MAQMNPLIGPKLEKNTLLIMAKEWVSCFIQKMTGLFITIAPHHTCNREQAVYVSL